jgi:hypothetical protein
MSELFTQTEYEKAIQQLKPEGRCFINGNFVATETRRNLRKFQSDK